LIEFSEVYEEQLPRVYGYVGYRVQSAADAEDLTQQTFERALSNWARFDRRRGSVATWLLTIARNLVIDHYRAGARRTAALPIDDVAASELPASDPGAAEVGISGELRAALSRLDERERELIALRYGADFSGPQIAAVTGLSLANVHQILSRALRRLREILDADIARGRN
jgi:RNA polymerase sigma-70 factor (ECF subfamily)